MDGPLSGLTIVEVASFIAAPICSLHLLQMGADVIRVDPIGGGPDYKRWPLSDEGASFYWEGLNKGKKSIAVDLSRSEGRRLVVDLIASVKDGLLVTNYPRDGFLSYERLKEKREDLIVARISGWRDGKSALDYTVNCLTGLPFITGLADGCAPVNHVLPVWDLLAGALAAFSLVSAERYRAATGFGQEIVVPLGEIAISTLGHLGQIAETSLGQDRPRYGNDLFGAFGRDFRCRDDKRVMIAAITSKQWWAVVLALGIQADVRQLEEQRGADFGKDQGDRFRHRDALNALIGARIERLDRSEIAALFDKHGVCWGPYNSLSESLATDPRFSERNALLRRVEHPSGYAYLTPDRAVSLSAFGTPRFEQAPVLGRDTHEVLAKYLDYSAHQIAKLHATETI